MSLPQQAQQTLTEATNGVPAHAGVPQPGRLGFQQVAPQGFGDRHNSWAWSMLWWNGKLYVGTNRAWHCAEIAGVHSVFPLFVKYPPQNADADCTPDPCDLPLQAEIWRWTPETDRWERVYRSPKEVPIPGHPGKYVARDVGFRDMAVFVEPDGTEALYVSGVNSRFIFRPVPPPRLLRSTDGLAFEPVPQTPGTCFGNIGGKSTLRTIVCYKGRLFVVAGSIRGDGILLESSNPAGGDDHFRQVSPPGMSIFEMLTFNGYLYLGLRDARSGYSVLKTDAAGALPYTFIPVVTEGAFSAQPSLSVISMHVYKGRLYVGTDRPAELIRINPDDTWDLVIGSPRETPGGWKYPISGLDTGFTSWLNGHMWRMEDHNGRLYIGTWNMSTYFHNMGADAVLKPNYGFDFYETADGWHFAPITLNGFDDKFNFGLRSFASTPYGLFLGTANSWYGLQIWRGTPADPAPAPGGDLSLDMGPAAQGQGAAVLAQAPESLEVEHYGGKVVLSWEPPAAAKLFQIWRANIADERHTVEAHPFLMRIIQVVRRVVRPIMPDLYLPPLPEKLWVTRAYEQIGTTTHSFFEDTTAVDGQRYVYYTRAEDQAESLSMPSNIVAVPPLVAPVTFRHILMRLADLAPQAAPEARRGIGLLSEEVQKALAAVQADDLAGAGRLLATLWREAANTGAALDPLAMEDLQILLMKLRRRVALSQMRAIPGELLG